MEAQVLDSMDLERERGITIKAQPSALNYTARDGRDLRPQPDRHARPRRLLVRGLALAAACEGALLVVDASQGVEAQTLANATSRIENNLEIIPVINKIDLPSAEPERAREQIEDVIGLDADDAILASAKTGHRRRRDPRAIVERMPPPKAIPTRRSRR
jgi:GTP-binding protein LepA